MKQQIVYNLEEYATKYQLKDIFGAYAAHFSVSGADNDCTFNSVAIENADDLFHSMVTERALFAKFLLVKQGSCTIKLQIKGDEETVTLSPKTLLTVTAKEVGEIIDVSDDFDAEVILVDEPTSDHACRYQIANEKYNSILDIFHFVRDIVRRQHINKIEMIRSMFNVLKLIIDELPYEQCSVSHDFRHKKEVYEIFLHHLYRNFRKERQIRFYADMLNVSTAYLSRLVKEISGSTINEHATSLVYKEICNLLTHSDMTIGEIADHLSFSDQSALTNFFKQRSGMSPLAYRNK